MLPARLLLALLPLVALSGAQAGSNGYSATHPLALEVDSCMAQSESSPEAMLECARRAEQAWLDEVERLTARLSRVLGSQAREALAEADRAWQVSRQTELTFIDAYHAQLERAELGDADLLRLARQQHRNSVLRMRAAYLQQYLDGLEAMPEAMSDERVPPP